MSSPFNALSDELLHMIFRPLLVSPEPLEVTYGFRPGLKLAVGLGCALLRVSKRFHRIAEYILYRENALEFCYSSFWLYDFHFEISHTAKQAVTKLRVHWPWEPTETQECLQNIANWESLVSLEILDFPKEASKCHLKKLPVKNIKFYRTITVDGFERAKVADDLENNADFRDVMLSS